MMGRFPRHLRSKVSYSRVSYDVGGRVRSHRLAEDKRRREGGFDQDKEGLVAGRSNGDLLGSCICR